MKPEEHPLWKIVTGVGDQDMQARIRKLVLQNLERRSKLGPEEGGAGGGEPGIDVKKLDAQIADQKRKLAEMAKRHAEEADDLHLQEVRALTAWFYASKNKVRVAEKAAKEEEGRQKDLDRANGELTDATRALSTARLQQALAEGGMKGQYQLDLEKSSREREVYEQMMQESGMGGRYKACVSRDV